MDWIVSGVIDDEVLRAADQAAQRLERHHRYQRALQTDEQRQGQQPKQSGENPGAKSLPTTNDGPDCKEAGRLNRGEPQERGLSRSGYLFVNGSAQPRSPLHEVQIT